MPMKIPERMLKLLTVGLLCLSMYACGGNSDKEAHSNDANGSAGGGTSGGASGSDATSSSGNGGSSGNSAGPSGSADSSGSAALSGSAASSSTAPASDTTASDPTGASTQPASGTTGGSPDSGSTGGSGPSSPENFSIESAEWLDTEVRPVDDTAVELVAHRAITLNIGVVAKTHTATGRVKVTVRDTNGNTLTDSADDVATGPASIPLSISSHTALNHYQFPLKAQWIEPGMAVQIDLQIQIGNQFATVATLNAKPTVGPEQIMRITVVPFTIAGTTALLPESKDIKAALMASWPLSDVIVTRHAPYQSLLTQPLTSAYESSVGAWGEVLTELDNLRYNENSMDFYLAFIPKENGSGTVGNADLPLVPHKSSGYARMAAIRAPLLLTSTNWQKSMMHEMGHTLNRLHAPCGTTGDPSYPFPTGVVGDASSPWGYDNRSGTWYDPTTTYDVMSYCAPSWVSWWSYEQTHSFVDRHPLN